MVAAFVAAFYTPFLLFILVCRIESLLLSALICAHVRQITVMEEDPHVYSAICSTGTVRVFYGLFTAERNFHCFGAGGSSLSPTGLFICLLREVTLEGVSLLFGNLF